jgi:MATE family multidrug resistance protein
MIEAHEHHFGYALKRTFFFSTPIVFQRLLSFLCAFVGMWIIAQLGISELAASALVISGMNLVLIPGSSFLFSLSIVATRSFAQNNYEEMGILLRKGLILSTLIGIGVLPILFSIPTILLWLHQDPQLVALAKQYCYANGWAIIPSFWADTFVQFFYSLHKQKFVMVLSFIRVILLGIFGYYFTLCPIGPQLGMKGIPYAFFVMYLFTLLICIGILLKKEYKEFRFFQFKFSWNHLYNLFFLGWPIALQVAAELIAFSMITIFIGWIGTDALAAQQIVTQINSLVFAIPLALTQAVSMLVSHSMGLEKKIEAKNYAYSSFFIGFIFIAIVGLIYFFFPNFLIGLYLDIDKVHPNISNISMIATHFFYIYIFINLFDSFRNNLIGALRGYHDTKYPMIIGISTIWLGIFLGYLFTFFFDVGPIGIQIGFMLGCMVGAYLLWKRFKKHVYQD